MNPVKKSECLLKNIYSTVEEYEESMTIAESVSLNFEVKNPQKIIINKETIIKLYKKYFMKKIQDSIVVIADILIIIRSSEKHHKRCLAKIFETKNKASKPTLRYDAIKIHTERKRVLESELITILTTIISLFNESDFELGVNMVFLGILTILREHPKFKTQTLHHNLVVLLCSCLVNNNLGHSKTFSILKSENFRSDSIEIFRVMEDFINDYRLEFFWITSDKSWKHFKSVLEAVANNSRKDIKMLLQNAMLEYKQNSYCQDP